MNLKDIYARLTRNDSNAVEFSEFEELMNHWAWEEYERQRSSVTGNIAIKNILDKNIEGF